MKKPNTAEWLLVGCLLALPFVYAGVIYRSLPHTIPTHFNIRGEADRFGEKDSLWVIVSILAVVSLGVYMLVRYLPNIDPKKTAGQSPNLTRKIAIAIVIFLSCISLAIVHATHSSQFNTGRIILPLVGIFFAVLGNYMHSIKPNYFVGFRTPWTLENEDNWRKTHQLVGKLWVPGGVIMAMGALLLPMEAGLILFFCCMLPMIFVPLVYSYLYFKKQKR